MDLLACSAYQHCNLKDTMRDCSIWERQEKSISPSLDTLMQEIKSVVFEKDELENRDISIIALFPILVRQDSKYEKNEQLPWFSETNSPPLVESYRFTPWWKNQASEAEEIWLWTWRHVKTNKTFLHFGLSGFHYQEDNEYIRKEHSNSSEKTQVDFSKDEIKSVNLENCKLE